MARQEKRQQPQTAKGDSVFDRAGNQVQTSPATAAAVPVTEPPAPPAGAVICNACSTDTHRVYATHVAPGWVQCPICKVKQRNLHSLRAAMKGRGGKSRAAR